MIWDDETILLLKDLWAKGHSTAEIGRRLHVSKSAVIGKAHRVGVEARMSPINQDKPQKPLPVSEADRVRAAEFLRDGATEAEMLAEFGLKQHYVRRIRREEGIATPARQKFAPILQRPKMTAEVIRVPRGPPPIPRLDTSSTCCWPMGEPRTKTFRFCGDAPVRGRPYCPEHAGLAYVRVRQREEAA